LSNIFFRKSVPPPNQVRGQAFSGSCSNYALSRSISSEIFSASMMVGMLVLPRVIVGMIDASMTPKSGNAVNAACCVRHGAAIIGRTHTAVPDRMKRAATLSRTWSASAVSSSTNAARLICGRQASRKPVAPAMARGREPRLVPCSSSCSWL